MTAVIKRSFLTRLEGLKKKKPATSGTIILDDNAGMWYNNTYYGITLNTGFIRLSRLQTNNNKNEKNKNKNLAMLFLRIVYYNLVVSVK